MSESQPLPPLQQSEVDEATIHQLFDDIANHAELMEIIPKYGPGYVAESSASLSLDEAKKMILNHSLRGLQLRYQYLEKTWWDTLMPVNDSSYRVVRIEHNFE